MLIDKNNSVLLLIDVQEKLTPAVMNPEQLVYNCAWLLRLAKKMQIPLLVSEQYTQGLGATVKELASLVQDEPHFDKRAFSCMSDKSFFTHCQQLQRKQCLLIGIETHVCVLQTAMQLKTYGYEVFVLVDATSSRKMDDYQFGLKRMEQAGVHLVTREMVFFEWLRTSADADFKQLSREFLQQGE
ncbi:MAG: hydrolase [Legionella sp. 40-6]|nr:hydrolase [Legionella sp.]OJX94596.1 MAG: hydrolase [Legionella sp. 40-6]